MRSDQPIAPTHDPRRPAVPCFVDWFPRAFGLMLVVLAGTFVLDLVRTERWRPSPTFELCGGCIIANPHPPDPEGEIH